MPSPSTTLIRVPTDLHTKLKELAHLRRSTMVDVIHGFIRDAETAGELKPGTSTFGLELDLDRDPPRTVLTTEGATLAEMTAEQTREFADKLELIARRGGSQFVAVEGGQVMIARHGTGIVIERQDPLPEPDEQPIRRSLNAAFAAELAERLRASV